MDKKITEAMLQANRSEAFVQYLLGDFALTRPVISGSDIGVDLYCESVFDSQPFLHFWVQVKSSVRFENKRCDTAYSFRTADLRYWFDQPVPVLALLIPVPRQGETIRVVHVVDLTGSLIANGIRHEQEKQTFTSDDKLCIDLETDKKRDGALKHLLFEYVPYLYSAMQAFNGYLSPIPTPEPSYTRNTAVGDIIKYQKKITHNLLTTSAFFVLEYLDGGGDVGKISPVFAASLSSMQNDPHYEVAEALGRLAETNGKQSDAAENYGKAIQMIKGDQHIDQCRPPWSDILTRIERRLAGVTQ